jgi:uncharacterized protein
MTDRSLLLPAAILGGCLAVGMLVGSVQLGRAFVEGRRAERFVTVRGLSEREVKADTATWPIRFTVASADLSAAYAQSDADKKKVLEFLRAGGIKAEEISVGQIDVADTQAREYGSGQSPLRYILGQVVTVQTKKVDDVAPLASTIAQLIKLGVVLGASPISYHFTGVNGIKPAMLAEATRNARAAAAQFAADSGSRVGEIRRAVQGVVSIVPIDGAGGPDEGGGSGSAEHSVRQKVRVVMTVEFILDR